MRFEKSVKKQTYIHGGHAYNNNVGWRIDYQMVTDNFCNKIKSASVYKANKFSDHAPLVVNYDI
jgi:exodeoxyribonuclease-3